MPQKVIKIVNKPNYIVKDFKNPPKKSITGYRTKTVFDKEGNKHLIRLALVRDKTGKIKTRATSIWHHKPVMHESVDTLKFKSLASDFVNNYFCSREQFKSR